MYMSNLKIGDKIIDDETSIIATVKSKRNPKTKEYDVLLQKKGYVPTMIRQTSLPKNKKEQDAVAKKWEQSLNKSGLKSKKSNKGIDFTVQGPKHTFRVKNVITTSKEKSPKTKVFIHPTSGRKFTITDVPKTRKKTGGRKRRRKTRKKKRRRRTKKKRRRRRRRTRRRKGGINGPGPGKRKRTTTNRTTTTTQSSDIETKTGEPVHKKAKTETEHEII